MEVSMSAAVELVEIVELVSIELVLNLTCVPEALNRRCSIAGADGVRKKGLHGFIYIYVLYYIHTI